MKKIENVGELKELADKANKTYNSFEEQVEEMTNEQALEIKRLRMTEENSWRGVAQEIHEKGWFGDFFPSSNQLAGMALCKRAGQILGRVVD